MSVTTRLKSLKINYLTQSQYDTALDNEEINENELYLTPDNNADFVVETGTSGIWTYRKWDSGIAECWGLTDKTVAANSVDSSLYVQYPFNFITKPVTTMSIYAGGADLYRSLFERSDTNNTQVRVILINKHTAQVIFTVSLYAIGKWK